MTNGDTYFLKGKLGFVYASYKTRERAESALEDMFSEGDVFESEFLGIVFINARYRIILRAE